jgi:purine-binding chemotaxis protein CheW
MSQAAAVHRDLDLQEDQPQYLTFRIGREEFAIGIVAIREIMEYTDPTEVPMTPDFIRGVINLRGAVVPVIDLCARFGREQTDVSRKTCIVILEVEVEYEEETMRQVIGVIVDEVSQVLEIAAGEIEPPPRFGARIRTEFISGMAKVDGRFVIVLDVQRVLDVEELAAVAEVAAGTDALEGGDEFDPEAAEARADDDAAEAVRGPEASVED